MRKIKLLLVILCMLVVISVQSIAVFGIDIEIDLSDLFAPSGIVIESGTCGENLTWTLDNNYLLTIEGTGDMKNWTYTLVPWNDYRESILSVVIKDGVTSIGEYAFEECKSLSSIAVAESITSIGDFAFYNCTRLKNVYFGGTESEWNDMAVGEYNDLLFNAEITFLVEPSVKAGDVNSDDRVNIQDVILLAQYCANWDSAKAELNIDAADTNGDGKVNIQDVIRLAQHCAGWSVTLG